MIQCTCEHCGVVFFRAKTSYSPGRTKYCSRACVGAATVAKANKERYARVERTCRTCGKVFTAKRHVVLEGHGLYCSTACYRKGSQRSFTREQSALHFWEKVQRDNPDECWPWTGGLTVNGYGKAQAGWLSGGPTVGAHRVAYALTYGDIPAGLFVCHRCDNRRCCNPAHLFLGTPADNSADMARKGRAVSGPKLHPELAIRGEHIGTAVLSEAQVREIRARNARGESQRKLAREFGVAKSTVGRVVRREYWKHV